MSIRFLIFCLGATFVTAGLFTWLDGDRILIAIGFLLCFCLGPPVYRGIIGPIQEQRLPVPPKTWEPWEDIPETIPVPMKCMGVGRRVRLPNGIICRVTDRPEPYAMRIMLEAEGSDGRERYLVESFHWVIREVIGPGEDSDRAEQTIEAWTAEELEPAD